jgi:hypothetical protein
MADTDITVTNGALARLGLSSITNFTDDDKSKICGNIYPKFANAMLSKYNWRFARKKSGSLSAGTTPDNEWSNSFAVPSDFLVLVNAYNSGESDAVQLTYNYEIFGSEIFTDETSLYIDYTYTVDEDLWPDYFQELMMNGLASELAFPLTEDAQKENFYRQKAFGTPSDAGEGGMFKMAKQIDSRQQPPSQMPIQSLISARFRGNR